MMSFSRFARRPRAGNDDSPTKMTTPLSAAAAAVATTNLHAHHAFLPQKLPIGHHLGGRSPGANPNFPQLPREERSLSAKRARI